MYSGWITVCQDEVLYGGDKPFVEKLHLARLGAVRPPFEQGQL